jgi:hypothetical protein
VGMTSDLFSDVPYMFISVHSQWEHGRDKMLEKRKFVCSKHDPNRREVIRNHIVSSFSHVLLKYFIGKT